MAQARHGGPSAISVIWLKEQFDQLRRDHAMILTKLDGMQTTITPELEEQVRKNKQLTDSIDQKVPDQA